MRKVKHTETFEVAQPIETVFPLFSAEGEKLWVPGWDYENVMGSTKLHEDYIFLTKNHDHASTEAIWIVKRYEPESHRVQFYKIEPKDKIGIITIECTGAGTGHTRVQVSYQYVGLSQKGNSFIEGFTSTDYKAFIEQWHLMLDRFFDSKC